jgi:hypothetical protein
MIFSTIERRDSKTPAGDMWHVLNINRRVEAAEAAIQGMTNLIDTINSDIYEMKNKTPSQLSAEIKEVNPKSNMVNIIEKVEYQATLPKASGGSINRQDSDVIKKMNAKLKTYETRIDDLDNALGNMATRESIKNLCSEDKVLYLIKENLDNFEPTFPVIEEIETKKEHILTNIAEEPKGNTLVEPVQKKPSEKACASVSSVTLKRGDSKESKTRIAYQEVSTKILFLEQEIGKAKDQIGTLEMKLGQKIEMVDIEGKTDQAEVLKVLLLFCFIFKVSSVNLTNINFCE